MHLNIHLFIDLSRSVEKIHSAQHFGIYLTIQSKKEYILFHPTYNCETLKKIKQNTCNTYLINFIKYCKVQT